VRCSIPASSTSRHPSALCGELHLPCAIRCRDPYENSWNTDLDQNAVEVRAFVTPVGHFFAGQRDLLENGAVGLRAGHVHLVTPCSPTSVWEESLADQLPAFAVVTFLSVVNPKPRPGGLVACFRSTRPRSDHSKSYVQEQFAVPFLRLGHQAARLAQKPRVSDLAASGDVLKLSLKAKVDPGANTTSPSSGFH
jgi:hypothetical protein